MSSNQPARRQISVRILPEVLAAAQRVGRNLDRSVSWVLETAVIRAVGDVLPPEIAERAEHWPARDDDNE
jgi:hypothetical protein